MTKKMKLPNGYGSIKFLGKGRRNPYAAYPPVEEWGPRGPITPPALGYRETWEDAYELLTTYNLEKKGKLMVKRGVFIDRTPTFAEVYEQFYQEKFFGSGKKLSISSQNASKQAFKNCSTLHDKQIGALKYDDLQNVINNCPLRHASLEMIVSLLHQVYKYAMKYEIVDKNYSEFLYIPKENDDQHGVPFSDDDLKVLWDMKGHSIVDMLLIMIYSGYRISAYTDIEVNLADKYFKGGVKTKSSKDRYVPIHSAIYDLVEKKYRLSGKNLLAIDQRVFRIKMYNTLEELKLKRHTPHDCRHTFSRLCEKYKVNENDRKRMMGHSFGSDITNAVYGHRTVEELREEIEKIKLPY